MRRIGSLGALLAACAGAPTGAHPDASITPDATAPVDLVTNAGWSLLPAADDPWAARIDPARPCDPLGLRDESSFFEIDTRICASASLAQPSQSAVRAGDRLTAVIWNQGLIADGPAVGHVALSLDGHVLLEEEVPIPSEARVFELDASSMFDASAGARIIWHVDNHGFNNWRIAYVRVATP